jgi:hypothetical protein
MNWWHSSHIRESQLNARNRQSEYELKRASASHTSAAIGATLKADDTREALEALLNRMERRRDDRGSHSS